MCAVRKPQFSLFGRTSLSVLNSWKWQAEVPGWLQLARVVTYGWMLVSAGHYTHASTIQK